MPLRRRQCVATRSCARRWCSRAASEIEGSQLKSRAATSGKPRTFGGMRGEAIEWADAAAPAPSAPWHELIVARWFGENP
jgi:hypothetical protein